MARTIAITGAASGLGRALAERLTKDGARVIRVDLRDSDVDTDLATDAGRAAAVHGIESEAGGTLDGLVVAAGVGPYEEPALVVSVNYFGAVGLLDRLLPALERGERSAALAIASIGAFFLDNVDAPLVDACLDEGESRALERSGFVTGSQAYSSTKRALIRAVRRRAAEWGARGVRLNALAPGSMDTPMLDGVLADEVTGPQTRAMPIPLAHTATAEEIAGTAAFLIGPDAGYVHGTQLVADGGALGVVTGEDAF
jgi:NAD(P)-dependent dehydrogenase (short-subunit alcohol dehydrogenase family)